MQRTYKLDQSPLYKLSTQAKLAKVLGFESVDTLKSILHPQTPNYQEFKTDKGREIQYPKSQLRRVHTRIHNLLTRISPPEYLISGVKGRSNIYNAKIHIGEHKLAKIDIAKYYPSVTYDQIFRCFLKTFKCTKDVATSLAKLCTINGHLPTGSVVSMSLAFTVNRPIFDSINTYCNSKNVKFTCYVDDMTFSGSSVNKQFIDYISGFLKKDRNYKCHKIRLHNEKTPKLVTGAVIDGSALKVKNKQRLVIYSMLENVDRITSQYRNDLQNPELIKFFQVLQGHLFSAAQINSRYRQKGNEIVQLRKSLGIKALNQNTM
jgi:hypothetical protein